MVDVDSLFTFPGMLVVCVWIDHSPSFTSGGFAASAIPIGNKTAVA
jgi:hypothetical protein